MTKMLTDKIVKQEGFKFGWKKISVKPTLMSDGFYGTRNWQGKAFDLLKDERYMILNAPMGSGKSWEMCLLSAHKLAQDSKKRCIIAVPQTIIAGGFAEANLLMPNGDKLRWFAQHDLCSESPSEGTIKAVIKWLAGPHGFFQDRILLCSHATLVAVYRRLKEEKNLKLIKDLFLWIDEAHHVKNNSIENFDAVVSNGIGELVAYILSKTKTNVDLGLATASFFRGDRLSLLTEEMEQKFKRFNLPYDEYLETMEHLESFSFDFLLCGPDFTKSLGKAIEARKGKDIVYIPHPMSKHSTGDKYQEVEEIISAYEKVHGGKRIEDSNTGLVILRKEGHPDFKIMDLVDEDLRDEKKEYILTLKNRDDLDVIIALGMFKEGANWVWADRSIIVGARSSLVDIIQMIGRLFRDAQDKKHVEVIQLLPFSLDQIEEEEFKTNLNNYLKAIYASLILENILHPVQIRGPKDKSGKSRQDRIHEDWLSEAMPDDASQLSLIEDISNELLQIINKNKKAEDVTVLWEEYQKILPMILSEHGIVSHVEEIGKQIWGMLARQTLRMDGIEVDDIDFDILQKTNPLSFLLGYTSGTCNIETFRQLRSAIAFRDFLTFENAKSLVRLLDIKTSVEWKDFCNNGKDISHLPKERQNAIVDAFKEMNLERFLQA